MLSPTTVKTIRYVLTDALGNIDKYNTISERAEKRAAFTVALAALAELEQGEAWLPVPNGDVDGYNMRIESDGDGLWRIWLGGAAIIFPPEYRLCRRTRSAAQSARPHVVAAQSVANGPCYISGTESRTRTASAEQED